MFSGMSAKSILLLQTDSKGKWFLSGIDSLAVGVRVYQRRLLLRPRCLLHPPLLRRPELLPNLALNPLLIALRFVYRAVYVPWLMLFLHLRRFEVGSRQE